MERLSPLCHTLSQEGYSQSQADNGLSPINGGTKHTLLNTTIEKELLRPIHVEVVRHPYCMASNEEIAQCVIQYVQHGVRESEVPALWNDFSADEAAEIRNKVVRIRVTRSEECHAVMERVQFISSVGQVDNRFTDVPELLVHVYVEMNEEAFVEEITCGSESNGSATTHLSLPSIELDGLWDSLVYEDNVKSQLLNYAISALMFADCQVDPDIISWNRVILLHGPPGTGKTSLCRALAQKLAIRLSHRFPTTQLIEVNSHSLFSRWFSESGKLVMKMFSKVQEYVDVKDRLVVVLIDEVESLTAMRQMALSSGEPSDSIRVVNALLTQLDQLKRHSNVLILTTSNITGAIDVAFVDRADLRLFVGPPTAPAIYQIYRTCLQELARVGIIHTFEQLLTFRTIEATCGAAAHLFENGDSSAQQSLRNVIQCSVQLREVALASCGLSGRVLRKVAFLTHANCLSGRKGISMSEYLTAMRDTVQKLLLDKERLCEKPVCST